MLTRRQFTEIAQVSGQVTCSRVLNFLAMMAHKGYLRGVQPQTQHFYAEVSSQFVLASSSGGIIPSSAVANATTTSTITTTSEAAMTIDTHVSQAVNGITTGVLSTMVEGEQATNVVTANIRAKMQNQIVSNLTMAPLTPPQSEEEAQYHAPQPVIQVVGSNIQKCNFGGGYAQTASVQFGSNPHEGSSSITSPLMQLATRSTTKIPKSVQIAAAVSASFAVVARDSRAVTSKQHHQRPHVVDQSAESARHSPERSRRKLRELTTSAANPTVAPSLTQAPTAATRAPTLSPTARPSPSHVPSLHPTPVPSRTPSASPTNVIPIPAYYVTLPMIGNKHYNLSQYRLSKGSRSFSNYSIPACSMYMGGKYVPCGSCNISSITMVNVTYGCYDITVLCPASTSTARTRRLEIDDASGTYHRNGGGTLDVGGPRDEEDEGDVVVDASGYDFNYSFSSDDRRLLGLSDMDKSPSSQHLSEIYRQLNTVGAGVGVLMAERGGSVSQNGHDDLIQNTFNSSRTDDHADDAPKSDDTFSAFNKFNVNEFGALAEDIVAELQTVLSLNFSQINLAKATPVLVFLGALAGVWLLGSLLFLRWDKTDRHRLVYLREYHVKAAYKLIKEDIHKGGTGVIDFDDPTLFVGAVSLYEQINRTLDTLKTSFSPQEFFKSQKRNTVYAGTHSYTTNHPNH